MAVSLNWLDSQTILQNLGSFAVFGVALIIFFETATILGSFLPGDSLLFLLGLSLSSWLSGFPIWLAIPIVFVGAVAGSQTGYWVGKKTGPRLFKQRNTFFFNEKTVDRTKDFFQHYGPRAIILARFIPVLRALVPMFVAIAHFDQKRFWKLNLIGGAAWVGALMLAGYLLGEIPFVAHNVELFALGFVVISSLPLPFELAREAIKRRKNARG